MTTKNWSASVVAACLCLGLSAGESPRRPELAVLAECELADGTRLSGSLRDGNQRLPFLTEFGKVRVPIRRLSQIDIDGDRESATLLFENGDRLSGFVDAASLDLVSGERKVSVPFPELRRCRLKVRWAVAGEVPLKVVSARGSGIWNGHGPNLAIDGDETSYWNAGDWKGWIECDLGRRETAVRIEVSLLFSPPGSAHFEAYASDDPIGPQREGARRLAQIEGGWRDGDLLTIDCPQNLKARYIQIACPQSVSWFGIREVRILPPSVAATP